MLTVIDLNDSEKWREIVKSFKEFDVYYLPEYTRAFEVHGDGRPTLFYFDNKDLRAINVVMIQDIANDVRFVSNLPKETYFDMKTPYGYGGFLVEGNVTNENIKILDKEYISKCNNMEIISEFVRFHPVINNCDRVREMYDITKLGKTVTIDLKSHQQIWNELTGKNRNVIRKAKKSGVQIYWGRDRELFKQFIRLYNETMDNDNASDYYYFDEDFYDSVLHDLRYDSLIFYAMYEEKVIAMSLILFSNKQMHYHLSASDKRYRRLAPTNLLLYEAACWGNENGFKTFHLGGGLGSAEDSLYKFKKAFNKNSDTTFAIGKKVFDKEMYNKLVEIRDEEDLINNESSFFPIYRM